MFIAGFILASCASEKIQIMQISGFTDISKGDTVSLEWEFKNADRVYLEGIEHIFRAKDSYSVSPLFNTNYRITAYNGEDDSLEVNMVVSVKDKEEKEVKVKRAPSGFEPVELFPSNTESEYLSGIISDQNTSQPSNIKIVGITKSSNKNDYLVKFLVLDRFGNYIQRLFQSPTDFTLTTSTKCSSLDVKESVKSISEIDNSSSKNIDFGILLDNSNAAVMNTKVISQIKSFLPFLVLKDNIMFSYFNQNYYQAIPLTNSDKFFSQLENFTMPAPCGLNAIYKSTVKAIDDIIINKDNPKALVIITYLADNSSLLYTSVEIAKKALYFNVPIYIVGIGNAIDSYTLKYLTSLAGGKFYRLQEDDIDKLHSILMEIAFSQRNYYEFNFNVLNDCKNDVELNTKLSMNGKISSPIESNFEIIIKPETQFMNYQALSLFDYRDTAIADDFKENLNVLSKVLSNVLNSSQLIELIGHSGKEGSEEQNLSLSLERVQGIRKYLIAHGTPPAQIRVRAEGNGKPVYYLESLPWQQSINRRVEMRWLDPSILPYEIIAETVLSEEEALTKVESWENRNIKAYYDRYIQNNSPAYRVKLWGYARLEEAQDAAKLMQSKYKLPLKVE